MGWLNYYGGLQPSWGSDKVQTPPWRLASQSLCYSTRSFWGHDFADDFHVRLACLSVACLHHLQVLVFRGSPPGSPDRVLQLLRARRLARRLARCLLTLGRVHSLASNFCPRQLPYPQLLLQWPGSADHVLQGFGILLRLETRHFAGNGMTCFLKG